MLALFAALALAAQPASGECAGQTNCVELNAAQLFDLADQLYSRGDRAGAAEVLETLTHDKHPELRAEARFRLAAILETMGDLEGAANALRDLLAEQPNANRARLELARILGRMGKSGQARSELSRAEKIGLPPDVEQNVRHFAASLAGTARRGLTLELTAGPDTNINRSTSSQFVDTIIAPFQLDADARQQSGEGFTGSARAYSSDRVGDADFLSNAGLRADLYDKGRFNDVQLALDSGPQLRLGQLTFRPAAVYERRWFGDRPYSKGVGGELDVTVPMTSEAQLSLSASSVRQTILPNRDQDGWRTFAGADLLKTIGSNMLARFSLRYARLDARARPESLRQLGGGVLVARESKAVTLFSEFDYSWTRGIEAQFLFGKTRRDHRSDVTVGMILNQAKIIGFSPLMRLTHTDSSANITLFEFRRTRIDFGVTRSF
jgi:outer membrane protein